MNRNKVYHYVDLFFTEDLDKINEELKQFCTDSIQQAKLLFNYDTKCIIFDLQDIDEDVFIESCSLDKIIISKPLSLVIKEFRNSRIYLDNSSDGQTKLSNYNTRLLELETKFLSYETSIREAVYLIFKSITDGTLIINSRWEEILLKHINVFHIGCHNMNHRYETEILERNDLSPFSDANFQLNQFITYMMQNFAQGWAYYKMKSNVFDYLLKIKVTDPTDYWQQSKRQYPDLGNLGLDMLSVPVVPKKVDLEKVCDFIKKYGKEEQLVFEYKINVLLKKY